MHRFRFLPEDNRCVSHMNQNIQPTPTEIAAARHGAQDMTTRSQERHTMVDNRVLDRIPHRDDAMGAVHGSGDPCAWITRAFGVALHVGASNRARRLERAPQRQFNAVAANWRSDLTAHAAAQALHTVHAAIDPSTAAHCVRVMHLALRIGMDMQLDAERLQRLRNAALLHDIGKIGVSSAIWRSPAPLTADQQRAVRMHSIMSDAIVSRVEELRSLAPIVRAHHEWINGNGYPDGLMGDAIPLEARIIAVADAYDAMTSDRPYRQALTIECVLQELQRGRGIQWDANAVDALIAVIAPSHTASCADAALSAGDRNARC